jgi:peptidoglycan hydrolase-like protein with peptidoglycan-binding domain
MENLRENLEKISYLMNYDLTKTITENLDVYELDEQRSAVGQVFNLATKSAAAYAKEIGSAFKKVYGNTGLVLKGGAVIKDAETLIKSFGKTLKGAEGAKVLQDLLNTGKVTPSLERNIVKEIAASKASKLAGQDSAVIINKLKQAGYSDDIARDIAADIKVIEKSTGSTVKTTTKTSAKTSAKTGGKVVKTVTDSQKQSIKVWLLRNKNWNWKSILKWAATVGITAAALWYFLKDENIPLPSDVPQTEPVSPETPPPPRNQTTYVTAPEYCVGKDIKKGMKGESVRTLQEYLNSQNRGEWQTLVLDAKFGSKTTDAVKEWQKNYGLEMTGIWGSKECEKSNKKTEPKKDEPLDTGGIPTTDLPESIRRIVRNVLIEQAVSAKPIQANYPLNDVMEFCIKDPIKSKATILRNISVAGFPGNEAITYKSTSADYDQTVKYNIIVDGNLKVYTLKSGDKSFKYTRNLNCPNISTIETSAGSEAAGKLGVDVSKPGDLGQLEDLYNQLRTYIRQGYRGQVFEMATRLFKGSSNTDVQQYGTNLGQNKNTYWNAQTQDWKDTYNNYNRGVEDDFNQFKNPPQGTDQYYTPLTIDLSALGVTKPQTIYLFKMGGESAVVSGGTQTRISPQVQSLGRCFGDLFLLYHYATTSEPTDPIIPGTDMVKRTVLQCMREGNYENRNILKRLTDRGFENEVTTSLTDSKYKDIKDNRGNNRYDLRKVNTYLQFVLSPAAGKYMATSPKPAQPKQTDNRF